MLEQLEGTFTQKQKLMLDIALAEGVRSSLLKPLDPSRCPDVERNFFCDWCHASEDIRFSHVDVSSEFLHGDGHRGTRLQTLVRELVEGTTDSAQIPALVAVRVQGIRHVVCGNRRLKCYKMAWQRGVDCWFKMIVHDSCPPFKTCFRQSLLFWFTELVYTSLRMCRACPIISNSQKTIITMIEQPFTNHHHLLLLVVGCSGIDTTSYAIDQN